MNVKDEDFIKLMFLNDLVDRKKIFSAYFPHNNYNIVLRNYNKNDKVKKKIMLSRDYCLYIR